RRRRGRAHLWLRVQRRPRPQKQLPLRVLWSLEGDSQPELRGAWQTGPGRNRWPHRSETAESGANEVSVRQAGQARAQAISARIGQSSVGRHTASRRQRRNRRQRAAERRRGETSRADQVRDVERIEYLCGRFKPDGTFKRQAVRQLKVLGHERVAETGAVGQLKHKR